MTITPLGNKLACQPLPDPAVSSILDVVKGPEVYRQAVVSAVGPEVRNVSPGDTIYANLGTALEFQGTFVLPETAVLAIMA